MSANTKLPESIRFRDTNLTIIDHNGTPWVASADLARALGYAEARKVTHLYNRRKDEFSADMSEVLNLGTKGFGGGNSEKPVRIFSPRGCHLIAMFSHTHRAKDFRRWVLDILEGVAAPDARQPALPKPKTLTNAQRRAIQRLMQERWPDNDERRDAYDRLKERFDVARYRDIERTQLFKAIDFILSDAPDAGPTGEVRLRLPIERPEKALDDATRIAAALHMAKDCYAIVSHMSVYKATLEGSLKNLRNGLAEIDIRARYAHSCYETLLAENGD